MSSVFEKSYKASKLEIEYNTLIDDVSKIRPIGIKSENDAHMFFENMRHFLIDMYHPNTSNLQFFLKELSKVINTETVNESFMQAINKDTACQGPKAYLTDYTEIIAERPFYKFIIKLIRVNYNDTFYKFERNYIKGFFVVLGINPYGYYADAEECYDAIENFAIGRWVKELLSENNELSFIMGKIKDFTNNLKE
ncbi:MAG: hypothetical protein K2M73_07995 [Lachnospiraceae bacterium]|nr:hypothetical protein [Lachnospiraceae bacterium]